MTGRRSKLLAILATALFALAILGAWTQTWFVVTLTTGQQLEVTGDIAAPALTALALCNLVLIGALAIAGPFFRVVLSLLQALIGGVVVFSASLALAAPVSASAAAITTASGVAGDKSTAELVESYSATGWPMVSLVAGVLLVVVALWMLVTSRSWPGSSRKYQAVRLDPTGNGPATEDAAAGGPVARSSVDDWDSLSSGADPTAGPDTSPDTSDTTGDDTAPDTTQR